MQGMQFPPISEVKPLRKRLGLTQGQLAQRAGVSQSLIAKLEAGSIDPAYSLACAVFQSLFDFQAKQGKTASEVMQREIVSLLASDSIADAIKLIKRTGVSQMPVMQGNSLVGMVSEARLLEKIALDENIDAKRTRVAQVMETAPPLVPGDSDVKVVIELLRHYPVVVVAMRGKPAGLISRSDVLSVLSTL